MCLWTRCTSRIIRWMYSTRRTYAVSLSPPPVTSDAHFWTCVLCLCDVCVGADLDAGDDGGYEHLGRAAREHRRPRARWRCARALSGRTHIHPHFTSLHSILCSCTVQCSSLCTVQYLFVCSCVQPTATTTSSSRSKSSPRRSSARTSSRRWASASSTELNWTESNRTELSQWHYADFAASLLVSITFIVLISRNSIHFMCSSQYTPSARSVRRSKCSFHHLSITIAMLIRHTIRYFM